MPELKQQNLTQKIIGIYYSVYNELGCGFLESVYEKAMIVALQQAELSVRRQVPIDVWFRGQKAGEFYADLLVAETVLLELKAVNNLEAHHEAQLLNYLRATNIEIGLLLNFGPTPQFKRKVFANERKPCFQKLSEQE